MSQYSTTHKNYQDSVVAFLDILGFKNLSEKKDIEGDLLDILYEIKQSNSKFEEKITQHAQEGNYSIEVKPNIASFSDHVVLSIPLTIGKTSPFETPILQLGLAFSLMKFYISQIQRKALVRGFGIRGAVSFGGIHFDAINNIIVGKPLIEAIEDESRLAVYPRVIISNSLLEYCKSIHPAFPQFAHEFEKDFDGMYFVDYLFEQVMLMEEEKKLSFLSDIKSQIIRNIGETKGNLSVFQKWQWLASYFNRSIHKLLEKKLITSGVEEIKMG